VNVPDLSVAVGVVRLENPLMNASGCGGYGPELVPFGLHRTLGAIVSKGLSKELSLGAEGLRIAETPSGILNAIGLQNTGYPSFAAEIIPWITDHKVSYIANCYGKNLDGYLKVVEALSAHPELLALEVNVSCPNIDAGGAHIGRSPARLEDLVRRLSGITGKPLWVKLPPDTRDPAELARAAEAGGASALTVSNTIPAMVIDVESQRPILGRLSGGLSGPAVRPVVVKQVWDVTSAVSLPVVAVGGVDGWEAAVQMILAGATALQIGTGLMVDPALPGRILDGISIWMERKGYREIVEFRGKAKGLL
jgi:dihydroorotate dehydrogenase (NAD+) catalytic subunit